jgi:hypothetical protein
VNVITLITACPSGDRNEKAVRLSSNVHADGATSEFPRRDSNFTIVSCCTRDARSLRSHAPAERQIARQTMARVIEVI